MATYHDEGHYTEGTVDYVYDYDMTAPDRDQYPEYFIFPVLGSLSLIFCLLLALSILSQPRLLSPYFYVTLSWVFVNILHTAVILPMEWTVVREYSWTHGESGCRAFHYLSAVFMFVKAYHMPLAVAMACLAGNFDDWLGQRRSAAILIPATACVSLWLLVILPCIPYVQNSTHVQVGFNRKAFWCLKQPEDVKTVFFAELLGHYICPVVLSIGLLLVFGRSLIKHPNTSDTRKTEVLSILVIVHVFILTHAAHYVVDYHLVAKDYLQGDLKIASKVSHVVSLFDLVLAPGICLLLPLMRNVFCLPCTLYTKYRRGRNQALSIPLDDKSDTHI